jgi:hypothetical protein
VTTETLGVVDGDALLLHVLRHPVLDEEPGGQTLPVFFLFQSVLANLMIDVGAVRLPFCGPMRAWCARRILL